MVFPYFVLYTPYSKAVVLDDIQCTGNEKSLEECLPVGLDIHTYCRNQYDEVRVVCSNGKNLLLFLMNLKSEFKT